MIASPSDTQEDREVLRDAIREWNEFNARALEVVLLPVLWESHATPQSGGRPQEFLNKQLVESSDLLVALFWTKLGAPTGEAESGTVEEIREFVGAGKPCLVYFSTRPVSPVNIDPDQVKAVNRFREEISGQVLYGTYDSTVELRQRAKEDLTRTVRELLEAGKLSSEHISTTQSPAQTADPPGVSNEATEEYRAALRGHLAKWRAQWPSLQGGYSVDGPKELAREIRATLYDFVRALTTIGADEKVIAVISNAAQLAVNAQNMPISLDGGMSYGAMNSLITGALDAVASVLTNPWRLGSGSGTDAGAPAG